MFKKTWENIFNTDKELKIKEDSLNIRNRFIAYKNLPKFFKLVWLTNPWLCFVNLTFRIFQAFLPLGVLSVGKNIIDQVVLITQNKSLSHTYLWKLVVIEFVLIVIITVLSRITALIDELLGELLTNRTNVMIMSHAATLDLTQFEDSVYYDKLERARKQTVGRSALLSQVFSQAQDTITMFSYIVILVAFNWWLILILMVCVIPSIIGSAYFNAKNYHLIRSQTQGRRELDYLNLIGCSDSSAKEVRLFNLSSFFITRYKKISIGFYKAKRKLGVNQSIVGILLYLPGAIGFYISFVYIIDQVIIGALTLGGLTFLLGTIRQLGSLVQNSAKRLKNVAEGAIYLQDFFDFFKIKPAISRPVNPRPFPNPIKEGFVFENVGFKYNNSNRWANRNLNFTLLPGEKLALVGENGAGKTTLVKLLVRLYDPTEGRVLLDGHDLKEYDLDDLRMQMGVIFQDFLRYQLSVSENIAVGNLKEINNNDLIIKSAKQSLADKIIERLPDQYQQLLGLHFNNGVELSGGEWQKVALARAYMRNAQIIILDEPTAALDARSEYEVFQRFSDVTANKTAVLISHRFSTVRMADRIIVLEKGQLIEIGSHDQLLKIQGRYAELFELQALGYK